MNSVTVVLPTYNRLNQLKQVLEGVAQQQFYPLEQLEVVVVSDGSADGTDDYLSHAHTNYPFRLNPILQPNQGVAVARNNGIAAATGELILFIDDDVVPTPTLLDEHLKFHTSAESVVMGPMLSPPDYKMEPWVDWEQRMLMKQYQDMVNGKWEPTARQFYTGNTSLRKQHLIDAGGFDASFRRAEDVELAYRLADRGLRFLFNPKAIGYHYARRSFQSWKAIPYAYGRNDVIFDHEKGQKWIVKTISREFHGRHFFVRLLTRLCLDRPPLHTTAITGLEKLAEIGRVMHLGILPRMAYSGIFNLQHYQGVADQLGGRDRFFTGVAQEAV